MESCSVTNQKESFLAPSAKTERSYASNIAVSIDGKWMGYTVGKIVSLRSLEDLKTCQIFTGHRDYTSAVSFSPSGEFVASADVTGTVIVWNLQNLTIKQKLEKIIPGKVFGLDWDQSSEILLVYGNGNKMQGACVNWGKGNIVTKFNSNSKLILNGDLRKTDPLRVITGSEDFNINLYQGSSFELKKTINEHKNFVSGVRFSPDASKFVSVSFDKKIVIYESLEGEVLYTLTQDKAQGNHTMAIIGVCWLNDSTLATCSLDKTVKIWDLNEKAVKCTLYPKEKSNLGIPEIFCGINSNGIYIITICLSGVQYFWEISKLEDGKLPDRVIDGHQDVTAGIASCKNKNLILSGDAGGKIIVWSGNQFNKLLYKHEYGFTDLDKTSDENSAILLVFDGTVMNIDIESGSIK
jgi:WD40 repeat protein